MPSSSYQSIKRQNNWWEPVFEREYKANFEESGWDFSHTKAPANCVFRPKDCPPSIDKIRFVRCDFRGEFPKYVKFDECIFEECDFGESIWHDARFRECELIRCSISIASFYDCEFRECTWNKIGISGNATVFVGTIVTNPMSLINEAYSGCKPSDSSAKHAAKQKTKLERTRATFSRMLLHNLSSRGSEPSYYEAVQITARQEFQAQLADLIYYRKYKKISKFDYVGNIFKYARISIELMLLRLFGYINCWGESLFRPVILGILIISLFCILYMIVMSKVFSHALLMSFDVTVLVGYTKYADKTLCVRDQAIMLINMLSGIVWYSVMIPTFINRISKVR